MRKILLIIASAITTSTILCACNAENEPQIEEDTPVVVHQEVMPETSSVTEIFTTTTETTTSSTTTEKTTTSSRTTTTASTTSTTITTTIDEQIHLNTIQENSVAWLNYLAMLSQEINSSQNSRMYLEEAYNALINNTDPANVNELTESHLVSLLDIIKKYRMIDVKRERLQCIYEQNQAKAIKEAVPNPIGLLSAEQSVDNKKLIASIIYMAIDSYSSYTSYQNEINQEYLKNGWTLDDEAAENLHDSRTRAFKYMIEIVRQDNLPGDLALNEDAIKKFVECKNNPNIHQQIQFLESNENKYRFFGNYWLLRAECYYKNEEFQKCLDCIDEYEDLHSDIFRQDYYLAKTLPLAIASALEVQPQSKYIDTAERYLDLLIENTEVDQWALRYYAAEIYSDLYAKTKNEDYLCSAYDLLLDNINYLTAKQNELNKTYIADVQLIEISKEMTKAEKKQAEAYNDMLKEKRETELPEIYEPLALNCEMLFSIADKIKLTQAEKDRVDGILSGSDTPVFLTKPISNIFSFKQSKIVFDAQLDTDQLTLPISYVSEGATIKVTVTDGEKCSIYDDFIVKEVKRTNNDFSSFKAIYTSKMMKKHKWSENSKIEVKISNGSYSDNNPLIINFRVVDFKSRKIGWDSVTFEQVN